MSEKTIGEYDDPELAVSMQLSDYIGDTCKYCGRTFISIQVMEEVEAVYAGEFRKQRLACKKCWQENNKE